MSRFGAIRKVATRKLTMLEAASVLEDLKSPPGNRLEARVSDRAGQHSIRVNRRALVTSFWSAGVSLPIPLCGSRATSAAPRSSG
jgi:toxin HigB-1